MRPVNVGTYAMQPDGHPGTRPFLYVGTASQEQRFNVRPPYTSLCWELEDQC